MLKDFWSVLSIIFRSLIKLRKEMGNVLKKQQPDHRTDNSIRSPTGLQCSEKFLHPKYWFQRTYLIFRNVQSSCERKGQIWDRICNVWTNCIANYRAVICKSSTLNKYMFTAYYKTHVHSFNNTNNNTYVYILSTNYLDQFQCLL